MDLYSLIRDIPDFPQKGVVYKDITPLLKHSAGFAEAVDAMAAPFADERIDAVVAVEARGYILGAPLALKLNAGFVPVRKLGKLPFNTHKVEYLLGVVDGAVVVDHPVSPRLVEVQTGINLRAMSSSSVVRLRLSR